MSETDLGLSEEQRAYEAKEVKLLLGKPAVQEAFAASERRLIAQWTRAETTEQRERLHLKYEVLQEWRRELRAFAERAPVLTGH